MSHYSTPRQRSTAYNYTPSHRTPTATATPHHHQQYASTDIRQLSYTPHQHRHTPTQHIDDLHQHRDHKRTKYHDSRSRSRSYRSHTSISTHTSTQTNDTDGVIDIDVGDTVADRYVITAYAGSGTFGTVYECIDTTSSVTSHTHRAAIKIVRSIQRYSDAAYIEADILQQLNRADTAPYASQCVRLYNVVKFTHRGHKHVALVFELLGQSLYSFLKHNHYAPYTQDHVKRFSYQIVKAVQFCHEQKLIHTDLKLENVLLVQSDYTVQPHTTASPPRQTTHEYRTPAHTELRLIDFGGSVFEYQHHAQMIQTRQYRAPEVVLNVGWSYSADMWSVACMLAECATGELLFATHDDAEHVQLIERVTAQTIPQHMVAEALSRYSQSNKHDAVLTHTDTDTLIKQWQYAAVLRSGSPNGNHQQQHAHAHNNSTSRSRSGDSRPSRSPSTAQLDRIYNIHTGQQYWPSSASGRSSVKHVAEQPTLADLFGKYDGQFLDLLHGLLQVDPDKRLTAAQALQHEYFDSIRVEMNSIEKTLVQQRDTMVLPYVDIKRQQSGRSSRDESSDDMWRAHRSNSQQQQHRRSDRSDEYDRRDVRVKRYRSRHDSRYHQRYKRDVRDVRNGHRYRSRDSRSLSPQTYKYATNDVRRTPTPSDVRRTPYRTANVER